MRRVLLESGIHVEWSFKGLSITQMVYKHAPVSDLFPVLPQYWSDHIREQQVNIPVESPGNSSSVDVDLPKKHIRQI